MKKIKEKIKEIKEKIKELEALVASQPGGPGQPPPNGDD